MYWEKFNRPNKNDLLLQATVIYVVVNKNNREVKGSSEEKMYENVWISKLN